MVQRLADRDDLVEETLKACQSEWIGCQWEMEFGGRRADLRGLHSRQAWLAAKATRGDESEYWRGVFRYLEGVEKDAKMAAQIAAEAVAIWRRGEVAEALARLDEVIALESLYHNRPVYSRLRGIMQSAPACDVSS